MFCIVFRLYIYHVLVINRWSTYILYTIISSVFVFVSVFFSLKLFTLFTIWFVYIWNIFMENGMRHFQRYLHCMVLLEELRYRNPRPFFVFLFYDCCWNRPCFVDVFTKVTNVWVSPVACLQKVAKKAIYIRNHTHLWYCVLFFSFSFILCVRPPNRCFLPFYWNYYRINYEINAISIQMKLKAKVASFFFLSHKSWTTLFSKHKRNGTRTLTHLNTLTTFPFIANARLQTHVN